MVVAVGSLQVCAQGIFVCLYMEHSTTQPHWQGYRYHNIQFASCTELGLRPYSELPGIITIYDKQIFHNDTAILQ